MIRMKHPLHGFHHAYNTNDVAYLEKLGWSEDKPEPAVEVVPVAVAPVEVAEPEVPARRGPGRPRKE